MTCDARSERDDRSLRRAIELGNLYWFRLGRGQGIATPFARRLIFVALDPRLRSHSLSFFDLIRGYCPSPLRD